MRRRLVGVRFGWDTRPGLAERRHRRPASFGVRSRPQSDSDRRRRTDTGGAEGPSGRAGVGARLDTGLIAVSVIVVLVVASGDDPDSDDPGVNWLKVAMGILFLVMAANQWKKRPNDGQASETPKWMATIDTATPSKAAVPGAVLSGATRRPGAHPRGRRVHRRGRTRPGRQGHCNRPLALGSVTVAGSVLFYVDSDQAARPLAAVKQFMQQRRHHDGRPAPARRQAPRRRPRRPLTLKFRSAPSSVRAR